MDDTALIRRLATLAPADLQGARARARLALQISQEAGSRQSRVDERHPSRLSPRRALRIGAIATVCLAVVAAGLFSPPGQAVATWVAERFGAGHPGGPPTLKTLREGWLQGTIADGVPAYVLARGAAPYGGHYEFITFRSKADGPHCFEVDLPEARSSYGGGCEPLPAHRGLLIDSAGGNSDPDQALQSVLGRVSDDVQSVRVTFNGRPVETELTPIPEPLLDALGFNRPFKVYAAFVRNFRHGGTIEVTAVDQVGTDVAEAKVTVPDMSAFSAHLGGDGR